MAEVVNVSQEEIVKVVKAIKDLLTELGLMVNGQLIFDVNSGDIPYGKIIGIVSKLAISRNVGEKFAGIKEIMPILEKCKDL